LCAHLQIFQGRGQNTHAYTHSVSVGHRVYLNLETKKFYCLPDNYEIIDPSLADIVYVLDPTFSVNLIKHVENRDKEVRAFCGTMYLPGIVGLNNIKVTNHVDWQRFKYLFDLFFYFKANDYCNVVLQALSHVSPLRHYFLDEKNYSMLKRPPGDQSFLLVQRFGELIRYGSRLHRFTISILKLREKHVFRKLWNPKNFKAHVSPHEMLQAVVLCSKKEFQITAQGDAIHFVSWYVHLRSIFGEIH